MLDLAGKRVTVMGLGRFGGGVGVARFLASPPNDCQVLVTDLDPPDKLAEPLKQIDDLVRTGRVTLRLGGHNVSDFTTTDLVVANPAVPKPWENRFLRAATAAGIPITTEIRLLVERLPNRAHTLGVTGSAGKSTTSSMIAHALAKHQPTRRVHLGGNIGGSLLSSLDSISPDDFVVLELSSAMLYWLSAGVGYPEAQGWSPSVAVLTNIAPNHIDWHGSVEHYAASKHGIWNYQDAARDRVVTPMLETDPLLGDIPRARTTFLPTGYERLLLDPSLKLAVPGLHNRKNAALAAAACALALNRGTGVAEASVHNGEHVTESARVLSRRLAGFAGLAHRLQLVGAFNAVGYYNDSKCTTPDSALLALSAFSAEQGGPGLGRVHLIAGGYDKGSDLSPIGKAAASLAALYTIGVTGPAIAAAARGTGVPPVLPSNVFECGTLDAAVREAARRARPGDVVLLSPACASWDQFTNFEARGEAFAALAAEFHQHQAIAP